MEEILISVIITSYNQRDYLIQTIDSVINQTIQPHEIIIADDCSTDESVILIKDYMQKYPQLVKGVFQKENVGIPRNRNAACQLVTGNYVSILDGDDLFFPNTIEMEINVLKAYPSAIGVYSNIWHIDSKGDYIGIRDKEGCPSGNIFKYIANGKGGLLRSMVMDYSLLRKVGFLNPNLPKYDGLELTAKLAKEGEFIYIPDPLVKKREHSASDSKTLKAADHIHDLEVIYKTILDLSGNLSLKERNNIRSIWRRRIVKWHLYAIKEKRFSFPLNIS